MHFTGRNNSRFSYSYANELRDKSSAHNSTELSTALGNSYPKGQFFGNPSLLGTTS